VYWILKINAQDASPGHFFISLNEEKLKIINTLYNKMEFL